jgi:flavin-dependent dehydrogenase
MEACDVLIVGGGPAGSSCAWKLRGRGLDVLVLDKAAFPRDKVCAGWITPAVLDELEIDPGQYARGRVLQQISSFRAGRIGGAAVRIDYGRPVSYGIRRCEFDHYLLERSGARRQLGEAVTAVRRDGRDWVVNDRFRTPMLVAAGGHFCPVVRALGDGGAGDVAPVAAQEVEFEMNARQQAECRVEPDTPEVYFCDDLAGYGWCFRKGNFLNVGLGREDRGPLARFVASFCDELKRQGRIPADIPGRFRGHAYLLYDRSPRMLLHDGLLVVGDAAGLAYSQSGEGIRPAVESGLIAAGQIAAAAGDYRRDRLEGYARRISERFGRRQGGRGLAGLIPRAARRWMAAGLFASRWFVQHVVLDRWFLHTHVRTMSQEG